MKKFLSVSFSVFTFFSFIPLSFAQENFPQPVPNTQEIQVEQAVSTDNGPHFRGGESVWLTENLTGDVYVGGGDIRVDSDIDGDLLVGGGQVTISGHVTRDLRVGGGQVTISGTIDGNVTVGAGSVTFTKESEVKGSVVTGAGQAVFDGVVFGQTYTWAGQVEGNGQFHKNFQGKTGSLMLGPSAVIQGDVSFQTDENPQVADQSIVNGRRDIRIVETSKQERELQKAKKTFDWGEVVLRILMATVGAGVLHHFFPNVFKKTSQSIITDPWSSLGWGFVVLIVTPVVAVLSLITVIGVPLGGLVFLSYLIAMMTAGWFVAFAVGKKMYDFSQIEFLKKPLVQISLGSTVLVILTHLPVVGGIVSFVRLLLGLGAIWLMVKEIKRSVSSKKE